LARWLGWLAWLAGLADWLAWLAGGIWTEKVVKTMVFYDVFEKNDHFV
jgi:hypothetical protein